MLFVSNFGRPPEVASFVPTTFTQAMNSSDKEKWCQTCLKELQVFKTHDTYKLIPLPAGRRAYGSLWVFTIKDSNRYKVRLVAQGHTQKKKKVGIRLPGDLCSCCLL